MLREFTSRLFSFLFPETCIGCNTGGIMLCNDCLARIPPPGEHMMEILSLFDYRNPVIRRGIHLFKYQNGQRIGIVFGKALYKKVIRELVDGALSTLKNPVLIPIPLSKERFKKRGFNQSEILIQEMLSCDTKGVLRKEFSALFRTEDTKSQVLIRDRDARIENMKGCFGVKNKEKISGKDILLIDDVTTTGATILEARKILLEAGARKVIGVTVAH